MGSELQTMNGQNKLALWAERVSACRSSDLSVRDWCKENDICEQTYYRWQRKLYGIIKAIFPFQHPVGYIQVVVDNFLFSGLFKCWHNLFPQSSKKTTSATSKCAKFLCCEDWHLSRKFCAKIFSITFA